jgi:hypothetical protein
MQIKHIEGRSQGFFGLGPVQIEDFEHAKDEGGFRHRSIQVRVPWRRRDQAATARQHTVQFCWAMAVMLTIRRRACCICFGPKAQYIEYRLEGQLVDGRKLFHVGLQQAGSAMETLLKHTDLVGWRKQRASNLMEALCRNISFPPRLSSK